MRKVLYCLLVPLICPASALYGMEEGYSFFMQSPDSAMQERTDAGATIPLAIGIGAVLYLFNPVVVYERNHVDAGWTKEGSIGFGSFGQHRLSAEYSLVFRSTRKGNLRLGYKYDFLLKNLEPSNTLQASGVVTVGGGYFTNFTEKGFFGEIAYGYSLRNHKLLFFPHLKLQYTAAERGIRGVEFSFGFAIGIANPFIDLGIRRSYE